MTTFERVRKLAARSGLLTKAGLLKQIDSLALIDLVVGIEREFRIAVPPTMLNVDDFGTLEQIAVLVEQITLAATSPVA